MPRLDFIYRTDTVRIGSEWLTGALFQRLFSAKWDPLCLGCHTPTAPWGAAMAND